MTDPGPRALLRSVTDPAHRALEQVPVMAALAGPELRVEDLAHALAALHRGVSGLEAALMSARVEGGDPVLAMVDVRPDGAARIAADLVSLGHSVPLPQPLPPAMAGRIGAGTLWVLWGAHLGNQVTLRHVARVLGENMAGRLRYFATDPDDKARFRALVAALETTATPDHMRAWCDQAEAAFDWLRGQALNTN